MKYRFEIGDSVVYTNGDGTLVKGIIRYCVPQERAIFGKEYYIEVTSGRLRFADPHTCSGFFSKNIGYIFREDALDPDPLSLTVKKIKNRLIRIFGVSIR